MVEYVCLACEFISKWASTRTRYKCPSCDHMTIAVPFEPAPAEGVQEVVDAVQEKAPIVGVVDIEKFLNTKES